MKETSIKVYCPNCGTEITENEYSSDSQVPGWKDTSYVCEKCKLEIYTYKVEMAIME